MSDFINTGSHPAGTRLVLAHGAGAGMDSTWLSDVAALLSERGLATTRFEFAYMAARRQGVRKPPPKAERLVEEYAAVVDRVRRELQPGQRLLIGGKSMGGRVASLIADELFAAGRIAGLVCLSYPFHPPKRPEQLRTQHLERLTCPALIVQGERDPFGGRAEVPGYSLSDAITVRWMPDGDHDLAPRAKSGATAAGNLALAADAVVRFCCGL